VAVEVRQVLHDESILQKVISADYVSNFIAHDFHLQMSLELHVFSSLLFNLN